MNVNMNESIEMMNKAVNDNYASLRKLAELNLSVWDKMVAKQMDMMNMCLNAGSKHYEAAKDSNRVDELVGKQSEMVRECGEKLMEKNREMVDFLVSTRDEYQGWMEASVGQMKDQFAQAGETTGKATRKAA